MAKAKPEWITTKEAAKFSGYHVLHILRLIKAEKIAARKVMRDWQIDKASLAEYIHLVEESGKKRGPKTSA